MDTLAEALLDENKLTAVDLVHQAHRGLATLILIGLISLVLIKLIQER